MAGQDLKRSAPWAQPRRIVSAVRHIRKLRGGTQPHLLRASDGNLYITKFQNNPKQRRTLASEFLATRLGLALGLPMPEVRVVNVEDWLVLGTPEFHIEDRDRFMPCSTGLQLGIKYAADWRRDLVIEGVGTLALATERIRHLFAR